MTEKIIKNVKRKSTGIILAVFFNFIAWTYTWKFDKSKFWAALIINLIGLISIVLFPFTIVGTFIWCLIDMIVKDNDKFTNYDVYKFANEVNAVKKISKVKESSQTISKDKINKPSNKSMPTIVVVLLFIFIGLPILIIVIAMLVGMASQTNDNTINNYNEINYDRLDDLNENNLINTSYQKDLLIINEESDLKEITSNCKNTSKIYSDFEMADLRYVEVPSKINSTVCFDQNNVIVDKSQTPDFLNIYSIKIYTDESKYRIKLPSKTSNQRIILTINGNFNYVEIENSKNLDYLGGIGMANSIVFDNEYYWIKLLEEGGVSFELLDNKNDYDCCWNE
jgi:hypothetical protein